MLSKSFLDAAPLISVIMPSYNCAETIEIAIRSILHQTYTRLELIVVDDNSTDATAQVVERLANEDSRVRYCKVASDDPHRFNVRGRNINAGWAARNYGLDVARGEWVTFQDADDASLLNRIEWQHRLALLHDSNHVCIQWVVFDESRLEASLDVELFLQEFSQNPSMISADQISVLGRKTKGLMISLLGKTIEYVPFEWRRKRIIHRLFFGALDAYPGSGNCPLLKTEMAKAIRFHPQNQRFWPSFMGRGADRDFNFRVAEKFGKSVSFNIPLYLWRAPSENVPFQQVDRYLYREALNVG